MVKLFVLENLSCSEIVQLFFRKQKEFNKKMNFSTILFVIFIKMHFCRSHHIEIFKVKKLEVNNQKVEKNQQPRLIFDNF